MKRTRFRILYREFLFRVVDRELLSTYAGGDAHQIYVWKTADGKFGGGWGPIRSVIPATVERANP